MIKKYFSFFIIIAFVPFVMPGCGSDCKKGSGNMTTENRKLSKFTKMDISGGFKINIKQDTGASISITADDNLIKDIHADVDGDKLTLKANNGKCTSGVIMVNITVKDLSEIKTLGTVDLVSNGKLTIQDLSLNLAGVTKIDFDLSAGNVVVGSSGMANIALKGQASSTSVDFSGSGTLTAFDFVVSKYTLNSSGQSHCQINVLNELNVNSSGSSQVEYKGNPSTIKNNKAGASSLKKVD
jgi:hypothetical protein